MINGSETLQGLVVVVECLVIVVLVVNVVVFVRDVASCATGAARMKRRIASR